MWIQSISLGMKKRELVESDEECNEETFVANIRVFTTIAKRYASLPSGSTFSPISNQDASLLTQIVKYVVCICDSAVIRDFFDIWIGNSDVGDAENNEHDLYFALIESLFILSFSLVSTQSNGAQLQQLLFEVLRVWTFVCSLDEFDHSYASSKLPVREHLIQFVPYSPQLSFVQLSKFLSIKFSYYAYSCVCSCIAIDILVVVAA